MLTPILLSCALVGGQPATGLPRGGCHIGRGIGIGIGVGLGLELGRSLFHPRHCDAYYADPCHYRYRPVYVERPVYIQRPVYVTEPVYDARPACAPPTTVVVEKTVERPVTIQRLIERDRVVENGQTTTYEKVDGTLTTIIHGTPRPTPLDANAEMAALCDVRDEIDRLCPLSLARIVTTGTVRQVEVTLRATRFAPAYDRVTRRFVIDVNQLTATGTGLIIRFNNTPQGIRALAGDFKAQLKKLGEDCAKVGGEWYLDDQFQAEPKLENGRKLTAVVAGL